MVFMGGFQGHNTYFARYSSAPVVSSPVSAPSSEDAISMEQEGQLFILGVSCVDGSVRDDTYGGVVQPQQVNHISECVLVEVSMTGPRPCFVHFLVALQTSP